MSTFYDEWLATEEDLQQELRQTAFIARDRDIPWVRTRQDAKVKLMIANELGFKTMGSNVLKGEIPVGWHTGKHAHGEESMHILSGEGFSIVENQRFDWHTGTTIQIPYRAVHQHFNTGSEPAQYISGMAFDLEKFVRLAAVIQHEDCGPNDPAILAAFPDQDSEYYPTGDRAIIHIEDAPSDSSYEPQGTIAAVTNQHDYIQYLAVPANGFRDASVLVTHLWKEPPYHHSGRHKHLEAVVYAVEGEGYTEMLGERQFWEAGDVLYVPPSMWEHEHYNDNPKPIRQLRIQFGIRFWFVGIWPDGYTSQRIYDGEGRPIEAGAIERYRERE
jgi:quercetin dioxygenase-like cupin family protein